MTVLIVGADSWMGSALVRRYRQSEARVLTTSRRPAARTEGCTFLDLERDVRGWPPPPSVDVAILCAAVTSQKQCKADPAGTFAINVQRTVEVAGLLLTQGAFVIFPSSNLVFDGTLPNRSESAATCPNTEYGRQKAEAERRLLALDPDRVAILRFTKILGPGLALFEGWLRSLRAGEAVHPFEDLVMAPISVSFAAGMIQRTAEARMPGLLHVSADRDLSYADAARHLAARVSVDAGRVRPVTSASAGADLESVPRHTVLDARMMAQKFGVAPPRATDALEALIPS